MAIRPRQAEMDALGVDPEMLSPMEQPAEPMPAAAPAGELKEKFDDVMGVMAPAGNYSDAAIATMAEAITAVLTLFGQEAMPISTEAEEGQLPIDFVKAIMMLNQAQEDAGLSQYIIDVEELTNDRALQQAAGKIMALANNQTFKSFLAQLDQALSQQEGEMEEAPMVAEMTAPVEEIDEEELFMRRMR